MKSKKKAVIVVIVIITILITASTAIYSLFFSTARIRPQELISTSSSPNSTYELYIYKNDGGATTDSAILGVIHKTGDNKYSRNIYWDYHYDNADVEWVDDDTVIINGKRIENVLRDKYDFRYNKE